MSDGLRHRRTSYFVQVPRETIRDSSLSWKARGLLAYILDLPDGWKVRNRELAKAGPDGEEAVLSGLRQLREQGYYRLERRRLLDGTFSMAPSVSEVRVPEWAEDHRLFEGKPVSLIEVEPGRFMVQRPDGSTRPDDFPTVNEDVDNPTGPGSTEPGFSGSGSPGPIKREGKGDKINTPSLRSASETPGGPESEGPVPEVQLTLVGAPIPAPANPGPTFEDFYAAYPRKEAPKAAAKAWKTAVKTTRPEAILAGLEAAKATWQREGKARRFIPHPATWLNQGRWEDQHEGPDMSRLGWPEGW